MKILVKSTFPQSDGWGRSARDYLQAIVETENEVRANPIVLSRGVLQPEELPKWIPPNGEGFSPDIYIQQCLPEYFEVFPQIGKHVGLCFTESRKLQHTGWVEKFNDMDSVWVATPQEKVNLLDSDVKSNIDVVRMPMEFLDEEGSLPEVTDIIGGKYAFYFVGEWVQRKNITSIILSYWREFSRSDDVILVIKTNITGAPTEEVSSIVKNDIENLKKIYRLYEYSHHYPEVLIITESLTDRQVVQLHNSCNCFVNLAHGESTCRPLVEAAYREKPIICTEGIGSADDALLIHTVEAREEPCDVRLPPLPYLYTAWETWMVPDIFHAQAQMRAAYEKKLEANQRKDVQNVYSRSAITNQIKDVL